MTINCSDQEFDTIIAALRVYQCMLSMESAVCDDVSEIATEHGPALTVDDIDEFVERINVEEPKTKLAADREVGETEPRTEV